MRMLIMLAVMVVMVAGCVSAPRELQPEPKVISHVIICWLKDSADIEGQQKFIDASLSFVEIPGVLEVKAGPVLPSDRALADDSFDVAVIMRFEGPQALANYLVHPIHKQAIKDVLKPYVQKLMVYDFEEVE